MTSIALEELRRAYDLEEDQKVRERIRLISGIMEDHSAIEVATIMMVSESKVNYWRRRFREEGPEGPRDRPRSGRSPKVKR
jgi:transposase